jgi:serine/threonine-protein kinase
MEGRPQRSLDPTETSADTQLLQRPASTSSSSFVEEEGRFVPGTLLGGRYRVIALLGRGGMGEVYRATDLTLGQSIALKFLPEEAGRDQRLLERFHGEVRMARQVSHPNVCRVYDIGEIEGLPFISMEYVDGEDLASLLRRIGRLPTDKALETARKICAGLAAAHDRGIVHRDLKPHNIMMNRRGEVVIMDFGLAAIADQLSEAEARQGTPAYMSPEQLKGAGVTARSDLYALGLVLYELFTGKRPYEANSIRELLELEESARLTSMTSIAADVDPAVERAIRRCLEPDPAKRPSSALAVAAALPGGDPLAAALAAGETPSPELVAASGETEGLSRRIAVPLLCAVALGLIGSIVLRPYTDAMMRAPAELSPDILGRKAREIAASAGYDRKPVDSAVWLRTRNPLLGNIASRPKPKWDEWLADEGPIMAEYRESQSQLVAEPFGFVSRENPPPTQPGMVAVSIDSNGRLHDFLAIPYDGVNAPAESPQPETFFRAAGLDFARFQETGTTELPPYAGDTHKAWKGPHPKLPDTEVTVEYATWKGRVTMFKARLPWVSTASAPTPDPWTWRRLLNELPFLGVVAFLAFLVLMAHRNWRRERMDRKGAARLAAARFLLAMAAWIGTVHPYPDTSLFVIFYQSAADWLLSATLVWLLYVALEPAVRARWPHAIVTWNRLLAGRWKDPQVNAHILIGAAVGVLIWIGAGIVDLIAGKGRLDGPGSLTHTLGSRQLVGVLAANLGSVLVGGLVVFFALFGLRRLLRKDWVAALAAAAGFTLIRGDILNQPAKVAIYLTLYTILVFVLLRFGLVATVSAMFFLNATNAVTLGSDWKAWYAPYGIAVFAFLLGSATLAFWRALGSRALVEDPG